jgi:hypothetical protein
MYCNDLKTMFSETTTEAIEVLLGLPPLHLQLEAEVKARIYRLDCNDQWKPTSEGFGHECVTRNMERWGPIS